MADDRRQEDLDEDLAAELQERMRLVQTERTYTLDEMRERTRQRLTQLNSLNELMKIEPDRKLVVGPSYIRRFVRISDRSLFAY